MNKISKKKIHYPVSPSLRMYLKERGREVKLPVKYSDLLASGESTPLTDKKGKPTLWHSMMYSEQDYAELNKGLTKIYSMLKTGGDISVMEHLQVERIDYCTFGNSNPFRIRIINMINDNYDYFYVKKADASRVYGLELEYILSPNRISYLVDSNSLIEEHIAGIPGDQFFSDYLHMPNINKVRLAKEFVKFNERCFMRLLGDMRAYNYVVDITPDFEDEQYRLRAIDFDQQSYEGKKTMYMPQYYKENNPIVELCLELMTPATVKQYQSEEHSLMLRRLKTARYLVKKLLDCIRHEELSTKEKIRQLAGELSDHHKNSRFEKCKTMGEIVHMNMKAVLLKEK